MAEPTTERLDALTAQINELGYGTPEYHECMWFLLTIMARRQAIIAESLRASARKRERAAATRQRNREAREAAQSGGE